MTEQQYLKWQKAMKIFQKIFHCHQLAERSFSWKGIQFPLCARCTGILIGFVLIGPIVSIITLGNMFLSLLMILIMITDGIFQLKGYWKSTNPRRLITGLGFGYGCFSIVLHIIVKAIELIM